MDGIKEYFTLHNRMLRIFSQVFYKEPDIYYLEVIKKYIPVLEKISKEYKIEMLDKGIKSLKTFFDNNQLDENNIKQYAAEYAQLFLSVGISVGKKSIIPQESVYLSPSGLSMQDERDEVLQFYYIYNIGKEKDFKEPEDHICAEIYFISMLGDKAVENIETADDLKGSKYLNAIIDFMDRHLLKWLPMVEKDMCNLTDNLYFQGAAQIIYGLLLLEKEMISDLLS